MIIEEINISSPPPALEEMVQRNSLLFNSKRWLQCYDPRQIKQCVLMNKNREITGCFVYYVFRKAGFKFIITPPFTPDISLFYANPAESVVGKNTNVKDLMSALAKYFSGLRAAYVNLNLPAHIADAQPMIWSGYVSRARYTYHLDLGASEELLWKNLSSEKRKSIGKAEKDDIVTKPCGKSDVLYSLITKSLGRNAKDKNLQVLKRIIETFADSQDAIGIAAWHASTPTAAAFSVLAGGTAVYLFGGYDDEHKHHGAGVSCMWKSILESKARGLRVFDFEGSMDRNIERYFREFGPELVPYQCVEKIKPFLKLLLRVKGHQPL